MYWSPFRLSCMVIKSSLQSWEIHPQTITEPPPFLLHVTDGRMRVWRHKNTAYAPRNCQPTVPYGGGSVMVCGCISHDCKLDYDGLTCPKYALWDSNPGSWLAKEHKSRLRFGGRRLLLLNAEVSYSQCNVLAGHHCVLEIIWSVISWYLSYHLSFQKNRGVLKKSRKMLI
jgi:hypothetical protein